jgi:hypothetical protein
VVVPLTLELWASPTMCRKTPILLNGGWSVSLRWLCPSSGSCGLRPQLPPTPDGTTGRCSVPSQCTHWDAAMKPVRLLDPCCWCARLCLTRLLSLLHYTPSVGAASLSGGSLSTGSEVQALVCCGVHTEKLVEITEQVGERDRVHLQYTRESASSYLGHRTLVAEPAPSLCFFLTVRRGPARCARSSCLVQLVPVPSVHVIFWVVLGLVAFCLGVHVCWPPLFLFTLSCFPFCGMGPKV